MPARPLSLALAVVGSAYIVDLFLRWGPSDYTVDGVETGLGSTSLGPAVVLVLWESLGAAGISRTQRSDSLVAFLLSFATALFAIGAVVNLRWGGLTLFQGTGYGAWLGLFLAGLLVTGGLAHLLALDRAPATDPPSRELSAVLAFVTGVYLVNLMLPWGPNEGLVNGRLVPHGIDLLPGWGLSTALALLLWEGLGALSFRRTARLDSLVAAVLAATAALIGIAALVELQWSARFDDSRSLAYGAWIAIPLIVLLLVGACAHLIGHVRRSRMPA